MTRDPSRYYRHLIFDNSLTETNYAFSRGHAVAPSRLELIDGKLPVSKRRFVSPPNSLKLAWTSQRGGDWRAELHVERWRNRALRLEGDTLSLWCYSEDVLAAAALPIIVLELRGGPRTRPLRLGEMVPGLPAGEWVQVTIPLSAFGTSTAELPFEQLHKVIFSQSIDDGEPHTLYLDEVKLRFAGEEATPSIPSGLTARAYDRHVELRWTPADEATVEYYAVHRSGDGHTFEPVGIQHPGFSRYTDFIGETDVEVFYRLTAVGRDYSVSEASEGVSARTRAFSDDELLDMVQEASFRYYWEGAHPVAGMALECVPGDENFVALGASGFGILALIVGVARGFITRDEGLTRLHTITEFLSEAERFHGVWPHFLDGRTGKVVPLFGPYDNGGDLLETAFLVQGLLTARQFFGGDNAAERELRDTITRLWETVEWDWYRKTPEGDFLFWHWSPDHGWHIDHPLIGWNETMITYLLAVASPTHPVPPSLYYSGWASPSEEAQRYRQNWGKTTAGDAYSNGERYYGLELPVGVGSGGPLFFTHYSFLGFDPRNKRDAFTNYFHNNRVLSLINHRYCVENPGGYKGYSERFWGLSASDDHTGYLAHDPTPKNDNGTVSPTAALSAMPYTPEESMAALKHFYYDLGEVMWDVYGFRDAYNPTVNYVSSIYMGLNQAPIAVMIENYRSGLLWDTFMSNPEMSGMLEKLGFAVEPT